MSTTYIFKFIFLYFVKISNYSIENLTSHLRLTNKEVKKMYKNRKKKKTKHPQLIEKFHEDEFSYVTSNGSLKLLKTIKKTLNTIYD